MRIKHRQQWATVPECHILIRAVLRRLEQLCASYGPEPLTLPFGDLVRQAEQVAIREVRTRWVDWGRTSAATGQHMQLGGFIGDAVYTDVPLPLRQLLILGSYLHIGKATVFGHGGYRVEGGQGAFSSKCG